MAGTGDASISDGTERLREWLAGLREWLLDMAAVAVPGCQPRDVSGPAPAGSGAEQWITVAIELPIPAGVDAPTALYAFARRLQVAGWWMRDIKERAGAPTLSATRNHLEITVRWEGERFLLNASAPPEHPAQFTRQPGEWLGQKDTLVLQHNSDPRQIFLVKTGDGTARASGPLEYSGHVPVSQRSPEELGSWLLEHRDELHELADYFHFYHYPADVVAWIEATPVVGAQVYEFRWARAGRTVVEVAQRLGLDAKVLDQAGADESWGEGAYDAAGDPLYHMSFNGNWAMGEAAYEPVRIDPDALRFKLWLSLEN